MITSTAFAGKHYAVLGLARSGLATVQALLTSGAKVTAWDDNEEARAALTPSPQRGEGWGEGAPRSRTISGAEHPHPTLSLQGEGLKVANFIESDLTQFDSIVVTPGLPLNRHPIAQLAADAGLEIIGDIELFARARAELPPHNVVGITGTNGKSTTTALVHHILQTAGVPSLMGGNIGLPILAQDPLPEGGVYVLELSSYQIDLTKSLDCDVAVLLNITPDHLDRYEDFEAYCQSKLRLFQMQSQNSFGILNNSDEAVWQAEDAIELGSFAYHGKLFGMLTFPDRLYELHDEYWGVLYNRELFQFRQDDWPSLQGPHNLENVAAAVSVAELLSVPLSWLEKAFCTYPGLPHRMERVREKDGVLFVNDSKATNATATAPALAAFPSIRWILGGQAKSDNLDECAPHFSHVRSAYTIGEAGGLFARLLGPHMPVAECGTLDAAVRAAAHDAKAGDTVLLSPACASFDQFRDFEARGDAFREYVRAL